MKTKNSRQLRAFRAAAVGFILLTSLSCTPEPFPAEVCVQGDCLATFNLGSGIDANGYYHVKLNYNGLYDDRFTINGIASAVNEQYYYNDMPAVSATFKGDKSIEIPIATHLNLTEVIPVVQETQVYFSGKTSWLSTKRIVGPITRELKGDTLTVKVNVFWDAGDNSISKNFFLKIVLD